MPNDTAKTNYLYCLTQSADEVSHNLGDMIDKLFQYLYNKPDLGKSHKTLLFDFNIYKKICFDDFEYEKAVKKRIKSILDPKNPKRVTVSSETVFQNRNNYLISDKKYEEAFKTLVKSQIEKLNFSSDDNDIFNQLISILAPNKYSCNVNLLELIMPYMDDDQKRHYTNYNLKSINKAFAKDKTDNGNEFDMQKGYYDFRV